MAVVAEASAPVRICLEVEVVGGESGVQDQWSAAFGGINYLEIDPYPQVEVTPLPEWAELGRGLSLVFLGRAHDSTEVHRRVIEHARGPGAVSLAQLREAASAACRAVRAQDLQGFARAMVTNTDAQMSLHPETVGSDARRVIEAVASAGAIGWKVNGAGGEGGSMTIVSPDESRKEAVDRCVTALSAAYRVVPVETSARGLTVRPLPAG